MTRWMIRIAVGSAVVVSAGAIFGIVWAARAPGDGWAVVRPTAVPPWAVRIALIDAALAEHNLSRAFYEWREAYGEAFRSGRWDALVAVGDAAVRLDAAAGARAGFRAEARRTYLAALVRARTLRSRAGAQRVAEAFALLGDREMADYASRIAADLS